MGEVCFDYQDGVTTNNTPIIRRQCFCGTTACTGAVNSKAEICKTCCKTECDYSTTGCPWYVDYEHLKWLISELTTQSSEPNPISKCHNAPTTLEGGLGDFKDSDRPVTMHYECTECHEACDVAIASADADRQTPASTFIEDELGEILKGMYYRGKDGMGLSDYDLNDAKSQILSIIDKAVLGENKRCIEMMTDIFAENFHYRIMCGEYKDPSGKMDVNKIFIEYQELEPERKKFAQYVDERVAELESAKELSPNSELKGSK